MTRRVLIIDDLQVRHDRFNSILKPLGYEVDNAYTVGEAIRFFLGHNQSIFDMGEPKYSCIFLDHDIEFGGDRRDVIEFVKWLVSDERVVKRLIADRTNFFIHSHNTVGAPNMFNILRRAGLNVRIRKFEG